MSGSQYSSIENKIELWYSGLGEAYYLSRGGKAGVGYSDSVKLRKIYYLVVSINFFFMSISCVYVSTLFIEMTELDWLVGLCWLAALSGVIAGKYFLKAFFNLKRIIFNNKNPDYYDPVRVKAIERAYEWGVKKNRIRLDSSTGKECFLNSNK